MTEYNPDCWVILKITTKDDLLYKVLAGWYGGFLNGNSWRMNSGITEVEFDDPMYSFHGESGSVYHCHKNTEQLGGEARETYLRLKKQADESNQGISLEIVDAEDIELE